MAAGQPPPANKPSAETPYAPPPYSGAPMPPTGESDATGGLIPYKNVPALIAYYLGVFSLIPCVGLLLGIPAVILGVVGLKKKSANPAAKGTAHAIVGIVLGSFSTILYGGGTIMFIVANMASG